MTAPNRDFIAELDAAIGCQQCGGSLDDSPSDDFCAPRCQTAWLAARTAPLASYSEPDDQPAHVSNLVELHSPETCVACAEGRRRHHSIDAAMAAALAYGARHLHASRELLVPQAAVTGQVFVAEVGETYEHNGAAWTPVGQSAADLTLPPGQSWQDFGTVQELVSFGFDLATEDGGGSMVAVTRRDGVDHVEAFLSPGLVVFPPQFGERMRAVNEEVGHAWADAWRDITEAMVPLAEQLQRSGLIEEQPPADPRERALWLRRNRNTGPAISARAPRAINPRRGR